MRILMNMNVEKLIMRMLMSGEEMKDVNSLNVCIIHNVIVTSKTFQSNNRFSIIRSFRFEKSFILIKKVFAEELKANMNYRKMKKFVV